MLSLYGTLSSEMMESQLHSDCNTLIGKHLTPLCTRPSEYRPSGFFLSLSRNLASPVPGEIIDFSGQFVASLLRLFHAQLNYITCVCLLTGSVTEGSVNSRLCLSLFTFT